MKKRFRLRTSPTISAPALGWRVRARRYLLQSWAGRTLLIVLGLLAWRRVGLPAPSWLVTLGVLVLWGYGLYFGWRGLRRPLQWLLWRIRMKLILSYAFVGLVPIALLGLLFVIAGIIVANLAGTYIVSAWLDRVTDQVRLSAGSALAGVNPADEQLAGLIAGRLSAMRAAHPGLTYALVRDGASLANEGGLARNHPQWLPQSSWAGIAVDEGRESVRALAERHGVRLVVSVPIEAVLGELERRTGIHSAERVAVLERDSSGGFRSVEASSRSPRVGSIGKTWSFLFNLDRRDWRTGASQVSLIVFEFRPFQLASRLNSGNLLGDSLVVLFGALALLCLMVYAVALVLASLLARSITRSIHVLYLGTQRLRQGDFSQPIPVYGKDQLGELSESFNLMANGIQDLLREQAEKDRLEEELRIARQIQMSLLPGDARTVPGLRVAAHCLPATEVGGDYYDLLPLSPTRMAIVVADVSGKGTSAALYMAELKGLILSLSRVYESPGELLKEANRILAANMDSRSFITMIYAVADVERRTMRLARAGHNPAIRLEASSGRTRVVTPPGLGLGLDHGERFDETLEEVEGPLEIGDVWLFYTDGLSEAMNSAGELFGEARLRTVVEESGALDCDGIKERLLEAVRQFSGGAVAQDDLTLVVVKVQD